MQHVRRKTNVCDVCVQTTTWSRSWFDENEKLSRFHSYSNNSKLGSVAESVGQVSKKI